MTEVKKGTFLQALIPLSILVTLLIINVSYFKDDASYGPNQIALLLAAAVAGLISFLNGHSWQHIMDGLLKSINQAMPSILILMLIGALAGTWLISGIVPAMIYYGLEILSPKVFLFAACLVCMVVSLATGSSWSTAATVGVALIGIGNTLGFNEGIVAGAIISGAYFGDKMSPLSDTTNLAPAVAGTDLFTHIRFMSYSTVPSILIALIIFFILGFTNSGEVKSEEIVLVQDSIKGAFNLSPLLFLAPVAVIVLIVKKVPALPALLVGALLGGIFAVIFQPGLMPSISPLVEMTEDGVMIAKNGLTLDSWQVKFTAVMQSMYGDTQILTGNANVERLLSQGGMMGMMFVILLVITAMIFGGAMEQGGYLRAMIQPIIDLVNRTTSLVTATVGTCVLFNIVAAEQYVSIVVPGKMFAETYGDKGLPPELLSRTLEDSGTVTSVLVPWNSCGAYHEGVLGVAPAAYLPYAFFNLISPVMSIIITATGFKLYQKVKNA